MVPPVTKITFEVLGKVRVAYDHQNQGLEQYQQIVGRIASTAHIRSIESVNDPIEILDENHIDNVVKFIEETESRFSHVDQEALYD